MILLLLQSNGGPNSIGNVDRPGVHAHNPNVGGQGGSGPGGSSAMLATVTAPPPPEFEMKGNDFPALPGMLILIIIAKLAMTFNKPERLFLKLDHAYFRC